MKHFLCAALLLSQAVAQEIPSQLSPEDKANLRAANAGYPQLPASDTNRYRTTLSLAVAPLRTQTVALVTVTIVTSSDTVMVLQNGEMKPYVSTKRPVVMSVTTNRHDWLKAPEVCP